MRAACAAVSLTASGLAWAQGSGPSDRPVQPEADSGRTAREVVRGQHAMVVTAHPLATRAAGRMLERGGSAVDAAIAAQMMLTLVEPQSSGLGGGGFLLHHDPASARVDAWDGRETAPASISEDAFLTPEGQPKRFHDAAVGGQAVGVPGLLAMLAQAHAAHGRLPWADLFVPAIERAQDGFPVSERLHTLIGKDPFLRLDPVAAAYFYRPDGGPRQIGEPLKNPELAASLASIAAQGPTAFYQGAIAADIVRKVREHPINPGQLSLADLASYQAIRREALCTPWLRHELCGMPPPSSGAIAVAQILGHFGAAEGARLTRPPSQPSATAYDAAGVHRFLESARLAFADRERYLGDPAFATVPIRALVNPDYLGKRASLIGERAMLKAPPGDPERGLVRIERIAQIDLERSSTTHLAIVDRDGRAVSMTTSIEDAFGARMMVRGFLLNNQLTDFSFIPNAEGRPVANRVEPGKRPRSSMAPTLVFKPSEGPRAGTAGADARQLVLALGSPGGASIIAYVARVLQLTLGEGVPLQQAIDAGHFGNRNGPSEIEHVGGSDLLVRALEARGHTIRHAPMTSGLHGIMRTCKRDGECVLESGTDPRREGQAWAQ